MGYVIAFDPSPRRALPQLAMWPDLPPSQSAFSLPEEAEPGDRVVYFVGGSCASFVALGRVVASKRVGRSGAWRGEGYLETTKPRQLHPHVSAESVQGAVGFPPPRREGAVDRRVGDLLVRFLSGKAIDTTDAAVEGAATESRSRSRNPALRRSALARAKGRCEVCRRDFGRVLNGGGLACLVVHHTKQISSYDEPKETRLADLAVVCANCHMLIHADPKKAVRVEALRKRVAAAKPKP